MLGFNDMSTLVGRFISSPREREKRDSRGEERERDREERGTRMEVKTEEVKHYTSTLTCYKDSRTCPAVSQYQLDAR